MKQFPNAIWSTNEDGHNFIQYSVINRSEKIYNLLYEMSEHKNIYKTIKDSSGNNLLHLAARLAPTNKLNLISGAALQIQRELQWFKVSTLTNDSKFEYHSAYIKFLRRIMIYLPTLIYHHIVGS